MTAPDVDALAQVTGERDALRAQVGKLRAALMAAASADAALNGRAGYDQWQRLERAATRLRKAALATAPEGEHG